MIPRLVALVTARTLVALVPVVEAVAGGIGAAPRRGALPPGLYDLLHAYRTARIYRRCTKILRRVDRAIERGDRVTAERLMGRVRVLRGSAPSSASHALPNPKIWETVGSKKEV